MKIITGFIFLILSLFSSQTIAGDGIENAVTVGKVKGFIKDQITCYCTEAKSNGLKIDSKALKKAMKSSAQGNSIYACGEKNLMLLKLPLGSNSAGLAVNMSESCYANAKPDTNGAFACWTKKNYIKYEVNCPVVGFAGNPGEDDRPNCKDLGTIVGAGSCNKKK